MKTPCCGWSIRSVALRTILAWIVLITLLIVLLIWNVVDSEWVLKTIWTATTLTTGILLTCVTIHGFATAEAEAQRRRESDGSSVDIQDATHLRQAMQRAKDEVSG
ncbi:MAG: hypothetical protein KDM63_05340 [Verrucomicrobiae bacterium]|nr:hypothetical protein [Verrucomicrobiae bacterium]MCB1086447.1 hypothetical protein [Verrucomicrobiae bacterium]